jgi:hypothetical protein
MCIVDCEQRGRRFSRETWPDAFTDANLRPPQRFTAIPVIRRGRIRITHRPAKMPVKSGRCGRVQKERERVIKASDGGDRDAHAGDHHNEQRRRTIAEAHPLPQRLPAPVDRRQ